MYSFIGLWEWQSTSLLVFEIIKFFHHTQKTKTLYCKRIVPLHLKLNAAVIREGNRVRALCTRRPMAASPSQVTKDPCNSWCVHYMWGQKYIHHSLAVIWGGQREHLEKHSNKTHVQELAEKEILNVKPKVAWEDRRKQEIRVVVAEA